MGRREKAVQRLKSRPRDLHWLEVESLLLGLGFCKLEGAGSRVKFLHSGGCLVSLHRPHPGSLLRAYQVDQLVETLFEYGLIR